MDRPLCDDTTSLGQDGFEYDALDKAIRDGDVDRVSELANAIDDDIDFYCWTLAIKRTENLEPTLRDDICALLINCLPRELLCYFLHTLLKITKEGERTPLLILGQHPDLFIVEREGDCAFRLAVTNGKVEVLNMFLKLVEPWGWQEFIIPAATDITDSSRDGRRKLITEGTTILDLAAGKGHTEIVKALVAFDKGLLDHGHPLHVAISQGHLDVIEYLLSIKVELVERFAHQPEPLSVLSVPRREDIEAQVSEDIDKLLVSTILKARSQSKSPAIIRKLLKGSPVQHREICLDLSMFGRPTHKFKLMVDGLVQKDRLQNLGFHTTLADVVFPFLDSSHPSSCPESVGPDAERVLQWLTVTKGVSEILRLIVPGSAPRTEREDVIRNAIRGISVVSLDWRVLDLSIDFILNSKSKNVETLSLYSRGNWGVLQQWSGTEGVTLLPNLKRLNIVIVKGMISEDHERQYIKQLDDRLHDKSFADLEGRPLRFPPAPKVDLGIKVLGWRDIHPCCGPSVIQNRVLDTAVAITKLANFLNFYKAYGQTRRIDIKVAIIDNGVDSTLPTLSNAVQAGVSLDEYDSGCQDPWWLASHPHGTQMANFVHQLDPFCHLYIAKVCDQDTGIDPDIVADAIYWAIEQKVDIISMSITIPTYSSTLQKAVESAKSEGIVIFGSRGDQGKNQKDIYPADYIEVISVSSLTKFGELAETTEPKASYFFQGEDVRILAEPCYLEPQLHASGSSVATALAAGVAALILSCRGLGGSEARRDRIEAVKKVFDCMAYNEPGFRRYVQPWRVFTEEKMSQEVGRSWLMTRFGENGMLNP